MATGKSLELHGKAFFVNKQHFQTGSMNLLEMWRSLDVEPGALLEQQQDPRAPRSTWDSELQGPAQARAPRGQPGNLLTPSV